MRVLRFVAHTSALWNCPRFKNASQALFILLRSGSRAESPPAILKTYLGAKGIPRFCLHDFYSESSGDNCGKIAFRFACHWKQRGSQAPLVFCGNSETAGDSARDQERCSVNKALRWASCGFNRAFCPRVTWQTRVFFCCDFGAALTIKCQRNRVFHAWFT